MKTRPKFLLAVLLIAGSISAFQLARSSAAESARSDDNTAITVQTLKTHSRLVIRIDDSVTSELKNSSGQFELILKGIGLSDLGAPLGEEDQWKQKFEKVNDPRLSQISIREISGGLKIIGKWLFPSGENSLADPKMEAFEYREKVPPQYVLDFWVKKGPTRAEVNARIKQADRLAALKKAQDDAQKRVNRRLAAEKAKTEREDITKFCREPYRDETDIFLPFLPVHEKINFGQWFSVTTPDSGFPYFEPETKDRDAQYVRVALELYREGKPALVIRTLEFFENEHPNSRFRHEMRFLKANALIKLGLHKEAEQILSRLMEEAKTDAVALHAGMFMAAKHFEQDSNLASLEDFLWLINQYPEHRLNWVFHLGAAESLYSLKQTDRAAKEYQWIVENAQDPKDKARAALRMGDLYLERFHYEQALASYFLAIKHFGDQSKDFPAVFLNRAEAMFWLGQNDDSKKAFLDFLDKFPSYPAGWRAAFRVGEILGKQGQKEESRKWFYQTINRYPFSPGATLARLRLIPCDDHGGFDALSEDRFFLTEATNFTGSGDVSMIRFPDLVALAQVRALLVMGQEERALNVALNELKNPKRGEASRVLSGTLDVIFRKHLLNMIAEGKKYEALQFYQSKYKILPKIYKTEVPDYLLKLSQAASDLGLGTFAKELSDRYDAAMAAIPNRAIAGENTPDLDEKLRQSEQSFTEAKALWVSSKMKNSEKIAEKLSQVVEESPFSYGRELIHALMDESEEKFSSALGHGLRAQLLMPSSEQKMSEIQIGCWLAALETKAGNLEIALQMYRNLEAHLGSDSKKISDRSLAEILGIPPIPSHESIIMAEGQLLEKQGKWGELAMVYSRAADHGLGGNQVLYEYARALMKVGDKNSRLKAVATLKKVAGSKNDDFWKKLAREALENAKEGKNE